MLFTKECDYAIRIVRALKDGNKMKAHDICACEEIPEAFAYKIIKKLEKQGVIRVVRGMNGGCVLAKSADELFLYDIVLAVEPEFSVIHCIKTGCSKNTESRPCGVYCEMQRLQKLLETELRSKTLKEILDYETDWM